VPESRGPKFRAGEEILNGRYEILHQDGRNWPRGPVETVASTRTGALYRVLYSKLQDRVLKLLIPPRGTSQAGDYRATFDLERNILARLSHGSIVRLYDWGDDLVHEGRTWKYHVTEWVEGHTLLHEMKSGDTSAGQCYSLISQTLRAVRYMHELGVAHGDIKHDNVRCRRLSDQTRQAVLLDLGCARFLGNWVSDAAASLRYDVPDVPAKDSVSDANKVKTPPIFATTPDLVHRDLKNYYNKPITPENREFIFPFHDIYAIGVLIAQLLAETEISEKIEAVFGLNGMRALDVMQQRIIESSPGRPYYKTVSHLYQDWEKLRSNYLAPAGVPELALAAEFKYSTATPLGRVVITPRVSALTSNKLFVRLGNIPQLELVRLKYSGASHTRLQHSQAVLRNARYYLSQLLNGPVFRLLVNTPELEATLILALLHDLGHYHLSHLFEDYASQQKQLKSFPGKWDALTGASAKWKELSFDIPSDDDLFVAGFDYLPPEKLSGEYGEVIRHACERSAKKLNLDRQVTIGALTRQRFSDETYEAVIGIHESVYRKKERPPAAHIALGGVLSSGLDADKVSYLIQDATETGVRFGLGIDIDGLLGALRSPSPVDIENATGPLLAINSKGLAAAESVLMARKLMYERVYWHSANRAMTAMVKYVITRLLAEGALDFPTFLEQTFFAPQEVALMYLHSMYSRTFKNESGSTNQPGSPIAYLLEGERWIYPELLSYSVKTKKTGKDVAEALSRVTVFDVAVFEDWLVQETGRKFPQLSIRPGDIIVDVPIKDRSRPSGERGGSVLVYDGNSYKPGRPLEQETLVAVTCMRTHEVRSKVCRIFTSRRLSEALGGQTGDAFVKFMRECLADKVGASDSSAVRA
jgi:HD superfamily phosphohydrolase